MKFSGEVIFTVVCISIFVIGWYGHKRILSANSCQMTYSTPSLKKIHVETTLGKLGFHLWQHTSGSQSILLNEQPVLFIPGYRGSMYQVRSLASYMHNNGTLQYFAVDMGNSASPFHANHIVMQAIYVNEALKAIAELYIREFNTDPPSITLIGHSLGGVVARLAVLLSNHPHCIVNGIVTLGSPSVRPAYTPDTSLNLLFQQINNAWRSSYFNESLACIDAEGAAFALSNLSGNFNTDLENNLTATEEITATWECPKCVAAITLVSISGGEVDKHVPPVLTHLMGSVPKPYNRSGQSPTPQKVRNLIRPKGGWVSYLYRKAVSIVTGTSNNASVDVPPLTDTVSMSDKVETQLNKENFNGKSVLIDEVNKEFDSEILSKTDDITVNIANVTNIPTTAAASPVASSATINVTTEIGGYSPSYIARLRSLTTEQWQAQMTYHLPSRQIALRTSQLAGVGFPIDHEALLWCGQLVTVVQEVVLKLRWLPKNASLSSDLSEERLQNQLTELVPIDPQYQLQFPEGLISPLYGMLAREQAFKQWQRAAEKDRLYLSRTLVGQVTDPTNTSGGYWEIFGSFWLLSVLLFSSRLPTIFICYVLSSLLMLAVPIWRSLANVTPRFPKGGFWSLIQLKAHFQITLLWPVLEPWVAYINDSLSSAKLPLPTTRTFALFGAVLLSKVCLDALSPLLFVKRYGFVLEWLVSYGAALGVHILCHGLLTGYSMLANFLLYPLRWLWSIALLLLSQANRRLPKKDVSPRSRTKTSWWSGALSLSVRLLKLVGPYILLVLGLVVMLVSTRARWTGPTAVLDSYTGILSATYLALSLELLALYLALAAIYRDKEERSYLNCLLLLYLPAILLTAPSAHFCYTLLFSDPTTLASVLGTLRMFVPSLVHYSMSVMAILLHLLSAFGSELKLSPVGWVYESVGPAWYEENIDADKLVPAGPCFHEEGGRLAIFEYCREAASAVSPGVVVGPAFRVLYCNCSKDTRLKSMDHWCDWCLCPRCGGKDLFKRGAKNELRSQFSEYNDLSVDLGLAVIVIALAFCSVLFGIDYPYRQLYIFGCLAASFVLRNITVGLGF